MKTYAVVLPATTPVRPCWCGHARGIGSPFDPTSAYQRAVYPKAEYPVLCPRCQP